MSSPGPVVHLELHTSDHAQASALYAKLLCWRQEPIEAGSGSCLALGLGGGFGGGIAECGAVRPLWPPYVQVGQVGQVEESTERPRQLGASVVLLAPREGRAGCRRVISAPQCGELAIWQPKP